MAAPLNPTAEEAERRALATLDEPVSATLLRDMKQIGRKLGHVLIPGRGQAANAVLRDWDLWGPLLLCLVLAVMLGMTAPESQSALVFAAVFFIVWVGAGVVTVNAKLLGGNLSFFQSVCLLGYCLCPLVIAAVLCRVYSHIVFRGAVVIVGFAWSTAASVGFVAGLVPPARRALAIYPVFLFYFSIAWLILVQ